MSETEHIVVHSVWYCPNICYNGAIKPSWKKKPIGFCTCMHHKDDLGATYHKDGEAGFVTWDDEAKERIMDKYERTRSL